MPTSTDWTARAVPTALSPERLAALVDRSISRTDGLLFTATPTEELDEIGRWQQLKDQAFAGQMRAIVASYNRAAAHEREFAADEIGLAIGATTTTGGNLLAQALSLDALPGLLEAVEAGVLTERHVLAVLRELHVHRNRRPFAETIARLLKTVRAHAGLAIWPTGEQALANVMRLTPLRPPIRANCMARILRRPRAQVDLFEIWSYIVARSGVDRADTFLR